MTTPKLATTTQKGRLYTHPITGAQYPSVTTVLGVVGKGDALKHWAALQVAQYAVSNIDTWRNLDAAAAVDLLKREPLRFLDKAANRGTDVHAIAETYAKTGTMPEWADEISGYVNGLRAFFTDHQPEPVVVEGTVFNTTIGYAGSFDLICRLPVYGNRICILDYKTSKAIYPDVAAQLAAYANAEHWFDDTDKQNPMPDIEHGVAVRLAADGTYEVVGCDLAPAWEYFKQVRLVYQHETKKFLTGRVVKPADTSDTNRQQTDHLRERLLNIKQHTPDALGEVAAAWPTGVPLLRDKDVVLDSVQQAAVRHVLDTVERNHSVPFIPQPAAATAPAAPTDVPVDVPVNVEMASDGLTVHPDVVDALRKRLNSSSGKIQTEAADIASSAASKNSLSLRAKPTLRRYLIVTFLLDALELGDGDRTLLQAVIEHDYPGTLSGHTFGNYLGSRTVEQITKMSTTLSKIKSGQVAVTYEPATDRFLIK